MIQKMFHLIMMKTSINGGQLWNGFLGGGSKFVIIIKHHIADIADRHHLSTVA
jgi:hypothetical protein